MRCIHRPAAESPDHRQRARSERDQLALTSGPPSPSIPVIAEIVVDRQTDLVTHLEYQVLRPAAAGWTPSGARQWIAWDSGAVVKVGAA